MLTTCLGQVRMMETAGPFREHRRRHDSQKCPHPVMQQLSAVVEGFGDPGQPNGCPEGSGS